MNKIIILGRCVDTPVTKATKSGGLMATFSLADNAKENGQEYTNFFNIKCIRTATAQYIEKYLAKGARVLIEGSFKIDKFVGNDGTNKTSYFVIADNINILDFKKDDNKAVEEKATTLTEEKEPDPDISVNFDADILDDEDLPF